MSSPYILTIYIAEGGTPLLDPRDKSPTGATSLLGHMWYSIREGGGIERSYGFQPKVTGFSGAGEVVRDDNARYYEPRYKWTMEISREQFEQFKEFGENGADAKWDYFKSGYNAASNSCVDFTWAALKLAGVKVQALRPNSKVSIPPTYGGQLIPSENWGQIQRIVAPFPDSEHNRLHKGRTRTVGEAMAELSAIEPPPAPVQGPVPSAKSARQRTPTHTPLSAAASFFSGEHRLHRLALPEGVPALHVEAWSFREATSQLSELRIVGLSSDAHLELKSFIGQVATVTTVLSDGDLTTRTGVVRAAEIWVPKAALPATA